MPRMIVTDAANEFTAKSALLLILEIQQEPSQAKKLTGLKDEVIERIRAFIEDIDGSEYVENPTIRDWMEAKMAPRDGRRLLPPPPLHDPISAAIDRAAEKSRADRYGETERAEHPSGPKVGERVEMDNLVKGTRYRVEYRLSPTLPRMHAVGDYDGAGGTVRAFECGKYGRLYVKAAQIEGIWRQSPGYPFYRDQEL